MLCYLKIYCKYIIYFIRMYLFVMFFKENYIFIYNYSIALIRF